MISSSSCPSVRGVATEDSPARFFRSLAILSSHLSSRPAGGDLSMLRSWSWVNMDHLVVKYGTAVHGLWRGKAGSLNPVVSDNSQGQLAAPA